MACSGLAKVGEAIAATARKARTREVFMFIMVFRVLFVVLFGVVFGIVFEGFVEVVCFS